MRTKINYDEFTVTFENEISEQALFNYYSILIDFLVEKFGKDAVRMALEKLIQED